MTPEGSRSLMAGGDTLGIEFQGEEKAALSDRDLVDGKEVLAIEVSPSRIAVGTTDGRSLRRAIGGDGRPACVPMHFHEMLAHQADRGLLDYSALVVPEARWEDLDPLEFERLRRSIRERRGRSDETLLNLPDLELARALGAVEANGDVHAVRVIGLLLFGKVRLPGAARPDLGGQRLLPLALLP